MSDEISNDELRDMAAHRGLKLVRSRRRKPGSGDFGKYGLEGADGTALLGIGKHGLTASAQDVEEFLRSGTLSTWKQSAAAPPQSPRTDQKRSEAQRPEDQEASFNRTARRASKKPASTSQPERAPMELQRGGKPARTIQPNASETVAPQPSLVIRSGKPADAHALQVLLSKLAKDDALKDRLEQVRRSGGGYFIAVLDAVVGCCVWHPLPTLQHGFIGRISLLYVVDEHRRKGIGTQLLLAAEKALADKGCSRIEVLSDIDIKNSHNFFRTLKFEQTSYRFARDIVTN